MYHVYKDCMCTMYIGECMCTMYIGECMCTMYIVDCMCTMYIGEFMCTMYNYLYDDMNDKRCTLFKVYFAC